jgi:hypothetical protein
MLKQPQISLEKEEKLFKHRPRNENCKSSPNLSYMLGVIINP